VFVLSNCILFLPAQRYESAVLAVIVCLFVCLSCLCVTSVFY